MSARASLTRSDFSALRAAGTRRMHGNYFSLVTAPLQGAAAARFGCVVSKKVAARAVDRNKIKRLCRECARSAVQGAPAPYAYVLYAKKEALKATRAEISADIESLFARTR